MTFEWKTVPLGTATCDVYDERPGEPPTCTDGGHASFVGFQRGHLVSVRDDRWWDPEAVMTTPTMLVELRCHGHAPVPAGTAVRCQHRDTCR